MYHVWMKVGDIEHLVKTPAASKQQAVAAARKAWPDGAVVSVLPA